MISTAPAELAPSSSSFVKEAVVIVNRLRAALNSMFRHIPEGIRNSYDVHRYFDVDTKLSWQIFKILGAEDELSLAQHIPATASIKKLLQAAAKRGVEGAIIQEVQLAYEDFGLLVKTHAGNRSRFDSMIRGLCVDRSTEYTDLRHRKAIFNGYSHFYGAQVDTYSVTFIVHPGSRPGLYNYAHIRWKSGICRLRADADIVLDTVKFTQSPNDRDFHVRSTFEAEPAEQFGTGILPQFSTMPLPQLSMERKADGRTVTKLAGDSVGLKSTVNMAFGHIWRDTPIQTWFNTNRHGFGTAIKIHYPTSLFIIDAIVHKSMTDKLEEHYQTYGHVSLQDDFGDVIQNNIKLPMRQEISRLRRTAEYAHIQEVPTYSDMLRYSFDRMQWQMNEFDVYRLRIEYPLMDTLTALWFYTPNSPPVSTDWEI